MAALHVRPSTRGRETGPGPGSYDIVVRDVQRRRSPGRKVAIRSVQWYQVQVVLNDLDDARAMLRRLVSERITVSGTVSGPVTSIEWNGYVDETADR